MTCSDCIHYIFMGHDSRCDVRPAHSPGFLNTACEKFQAGDSRKERAEKWTDADLVEELRLRGYEVMATKTIEL